MNVRPWLARPVDERIAFIRSARWIGTPPARAAHAMLQDLLVRPPSMRTTGLMGLKPLRQRQEHDRRTLRADGSEGDARRGRSPEGLGRADARGRWPAQFLRRHPHGLPGALRP